MLRKIWEKVCEAIGVLIVVLWLGAMVAIPVGLIALALRAFGG